METNLCVYMGNWKLNMIYLNDILFNCSSYYFNVLKAFYFAKAQVELYRICEKGKAYFKLHKTCTML